MSHHPADEPFDVFAGARKAASVIVLRDRAEQAEGRQEPAAPGMEVLMLRRAERDGDLRSGAAVFPGGVVDARDRLAHAHCHGWLDEHASARLGLPSGGLDYWVAAVRESFEEVGLLFAEPTCLSAERFEAAHRDWRGPLQRGERALHELCEALGLRFDISGWHYWSHWLTPPGNPKRFDTRFFITRAPAHQVAEADGGEAVEIMWLTPAQALEAERGLKLLPVTRSTLEALSRFATVDDALAFAQAQREIRLHMPRLATGPKGRTVVLPSDWAWAELGRLDPQGRGDQLSVIETGRAVRLSPRVIRVTAPNPGVMTGPGTNSYLVGDPAVNRWTVIDPGPEDARHLQALLEAAPGPIERILVTHTHKDHSPGARALADATGAPVFGRVALFPEWQDTTFEPQGEPADGDRLVLGPDATLVAVHTPGHASNHLCWLLLQEKLLFTGDHIMQGSTVVINPPDGDMAAYFASVRRLLDMDLDWFAPGHGFLVAQPHTVARALLAHRQKREDKVVSALMSTGGGTLEQLVLHAYDDTPAHLHRMAQRSLLAHLLKLQGEGRAIGSDERWTIRGQRRSDDRWTQAD